MKIFTSGRSVAVTLGLAAGALLASSAAVAVIDFDDEVAATTASGRPFAELELLGENTNRKLTPDVPRTLLVRVVNPAGAPDVHITGIGAGSSEATENTGSVNPGTCPAASIQTLAATPTGGASWLDRRDGSGADYDDSDAGTADDDILRSGETGWYEVTAELITDSPAMATVDQRPCLGLVDVVVAIEDVDSAVL